MSEETHKKRIREPEDKVKELETRNKELEEDLAERNNEIIEFLHEYERERLEEHYDEIRDLKNRMGFLRKEKVHLQQEFEKFRKKKKSDNVLIL